MRSRPPASASGPRACRRQSSRRRPTSSCSARRHRTKRRAATATLRVTVVNGDLSFVRQPLLLGHYRSSKLTGAEWVMNELIGGAMAASLAKGQYPDAPESHQAFLNTRAAPDDPRQLPRPEAVVIVGLGEEGKLEPADLVATVKRGVIAWAQRVSERRDGAGLRSSSPRR